MKVNFEVNENIVKKANIILTDLESECWELYRGAYGSVYDEVSVLAKVIAGENVEAEAFEIAFDNLCETLWHQISFYTASYLAIPYMLKLLEQKIAQKDFLWQLRLFSEMGMIVTCDIPGNHQNETVDAGLVENYNNCLLVLAELEKQFIMEYFDEIKALDYNEKSYFYTTALAVLGDRPAAAALTNLMFNEIYVVCGVCEEYNEEMPMISDGEEIEEIEPAEDVIGQWDGKSLDDTYMWYSNFLHLLGEEEAVNALTYYYGTYTCPECGEQAVVMDLVNKYFEM